MGRAVRNWNHNPIYAHSSQSLPNLVPLFPASKVSVVSYSTPNPDGRWEWDAVGKVAKRGKSGKSGERIGRDWEAIGLAIRSCSRESKARPALPALRGFGSFVFRPKPGWVLGMGLGAQWERVGRARGPKPIYVRSSKSLPHSSRSPRSR